MGNLPLGLIGRIIYAIPMLMFGVFHFGNADAMAGMVPIPGGAIWVYLTGAALVAAAVAIFINKKMKLATFLLGIMLLIFALSIHLPGVIGGSETSMPSLLKDLGLAGGAFFISGHSED
ncbi:MAG: DoxX family protein [Cyclobacteriaceae bacterium]